MRFDLEELFQILRKYQADIILVIGVILISLLSFAIGFIVAKQQEKEPIKIERNQMQILCEQYTNLQTANKNISSPHYWYKIRRLAL